MINHIYTGDSLEVLRTLPSESVHCCISSPPYYGLRDYGVPGQIGLEETPEAYVERIRQVFAEVKRVLRSDGTCWLNLGDSYAGSGKGGQSDEKRSEHWQPTYAHKGLTPRGYKPKDLLGIPWMVAFALRADGWYLRSDIIWNKPTAMPESVTDRPTKAHEYLFLLSKNPHYYYDADAIREPGKEHSGSAGTFARKSGKVTTLCVPGQSHASHRAERGDRVPPGRNKRSVWTVASQPYSEAHFATFPPKLIEPCVLAGTSPQACEHCGAPWERVAERDPMIVRHGPKSGGYGSRTTDSLSGTMLAPAVTKTVGWQPSCTCPDNTGSGKCIVLDPFMGAGTTAMVALQHGRLYLGIELNPAYVELAERRIATVQQHLWIGNEVAL